jgi:hypothetical protein
VLTPSKGLFFRDLDGSFPRPVGSRLLTQLQHNREFLDPGPDFTRVADATPIVAACSDNQPQISGYLYL